MCFGCYSASLEVETGSFSLPAATEDSELTAEPLEGASTASTAGKDVTHMALNPHLRVITIDYGVIVSSPNSRDRQS